MEVGMVIVEMVVVVAVVVVVVISTISCLLLEQDFLDLFIEREKNTFPCLLDNRGKKKKKERERERERVERRNTKVYE